MKKKSFDIEIDELADLFKIFGDSSRLKILLALMNGEKNVTELTRELEMSQSRISHSLKILKINKLVTSQRDGKTMNYSLLDDHVKMIIAMGKEHIEEDDSYEKEI